MNQTPFRCCAGIASTLVVIAGLWASTTSRANALSIELLVDIRQGAALYHKSRFADAEVLFSQVYRQMKDNAVQDLERYAMVIDFLAQSKSLQGKNEQVVALMEERLAVTVAQHGEGSIKLAPMQAGVAEAYYRDGRTEDAINMVTQSIEAFEVMGAEHESHLQLALDNLENYHTGPFDSAVLPMDLSEFFGRCDSIRRGDSERIVGQKMDGFFELDVNFNPDGFWAKMFEMAATGRDGLARSGKKYRRIFLPDTQAEVRKELCVVDQTAGIVVSADYSLD